jgi:7-cyano-7-deazaguanine synthase in queuosine biosynthesis
MAVKKCLLHIANHYKFKWEYSESTIAVLQYSPKFMYDSDAISFAAGNICLNNPFDHLVIGMHADDFTRQEVQQRVLRSQRIFEAFDTKTEKIFPIKHLTKKEVFDLLPRQLRVLAWSCRTPQYVDGIPHRCNICPTCKEVDKLFKEI